MTIRHPGKPDSNTRKFALEKSYFLLCESCVFGPVVSSALFRAEKMDREGCPGECQISISAMTCCKRKISEGIIINIPLDLLQKHDQRRHNKQYSIRLVTKA